jgi:hypothetical protein
MAETISKVGPPHEFTGNDTFRTIEDGSVRFWMFAVIPAAPLIETIRLWSEEIS